MKFDDCGDVRLAEQEDIPEVINLLMDHIKENGNHPINENKVISLISLHYKKSGGIIGIIGNRGERLKAIVVLAVSQIWYSDDYLLDEMSLYVRPEHRKSDFAKQLMKFAKKSSEALDLELRMSVWSNERTEAKIKLYKRQFNLRGAYFSHNEKPKLQ
jgi:GNAT superfamily N-acetyltransferase